MLPMENAPRASLKFLLLIVGLSAGGAGAQGTIATAPSDERFVPGEALHLDVSLDSAAFLNGGYAIDSAGYASVPVLGRIQVGGKSQGEVEEFLGQKLSNYLRDTHIRATPAIRLTLLGHFVRQGQYYVSPKATLWEAVRAAGGIAGERNLDKITVQRGEETIAISFLNEYSAGKTLLAAGIRSGDIFVIPVPRDNTGAWYWFRESLGATAQIATIASTLLTAYITYLLLEDNRN
jgi:protein involved in polysaccharide export with SLBB domain